MKPRAAKKQSELFDYNKSELVAKHVIDYKQNENPDRPFDHPARVLVVGPTKSGKTSAAFHLILNEKLNFKWKMLHLYVKHPEEPLYAGLIEKQTEIQNRLRAIDEQNHADEPGYVSDITVIDVHTTLNDLPDLSEGTVDKNIQHLWIFDDLLGEMKNTKLADRFFQFLITIRKFNSSVMFLAQHNSSVDRDKRTNFDGVLLFHFPNRKEAGYLAQDFGATMDQNKWIEMFSTIVSKKYDFLTINTTNPLKRQFRRNFAEFIDPRKVDLYIAQLKADRGDDDDSAADDSDDETDSEKE